MFGKVLNTRFTPSQPLGGRVLLPPVRVGGTKNTVSNLEMTHISLKDDPYPYLKLLVRVRLGFGLGFGLGLGLL
jgi:hypothetical protein